MAKKVGIGLAVLVLAWAPFVYDSFSHAPAPDGRIATPKRSDVIVSPRPAPAPAVAAAQSVRTAPVVAADGPTPQVRSGPIRQPPQVGEVSVEAEADGVPVPAAPAAPVRSPGLPPRTGPVALLKAAIESETRDALWATGQEAALVALGGEHGFEDLAGQVTCQRTACRVAVRIDMSATNEFLGLYAAVGQQVNPMLALEPQGDLGVGDTASVILYVPRKGYTLSDFE